MINTTQRKKELKELTHDKRLFSFQNSNSAMAHKFGYEAGRQLFVCYFQHSDIFFSIHTKGNSFFQCFTVLIRSLARFIFIFHFMHQRKGSMAKKKYLTQNKRLFRSQ